MSAHHPPPLLIFLFPSSTYVKKPITKSEWWNVISIELRERTTVATSCLHSPHSAPCTPPGYWLVLRHGTWRASCVYTHIIYEHTHVHTQTWTAERLSIQVLNWMSVMFSVLLVYDSQTHTHTHTKSSFPGVSMQGIYLIATYTFCRQCLEHKLQTTLSERIRLKHQNERDALLCSVFRMSTLELKKRDRQTETGQQFTYQVNKNKNSGAKGGGGLGDYIDRGVTPKRWATCSKCCWMRRGKSGWQGVKGGGCRRMRPALEERIVAFRHVWRPRRRGDFRAEPEERGVSRWGRRHWWAPGSFQGPLKLVRLVTRHWLQV